MSNNKDQKSATSEVATTVVEQPRPSISPDSLALAQALIDGMKGIAPPRSLTIDEFVPRTAFNPTGKRNRELPFTVYQNDHRLNVDFLHDEEIALLPHLKPGKFIEGLVTVSETDQGGQKVMHIRYKNGNRDQAMELKGHARNFTAILKRCVNEAKGIFLDA